MTMAAHAERERKKRDNVIKNKKKVSLDAMTMASLRLAHTKRERKTV